MAKDDYRFPDEAAFLVWLNTRPPGERWQYTGGYAVLTDGLWDGEHWHAAPTSAPAMLPAGRPRLYQRLARALSARRRPDFSTPDKFLDWSSRKRDDP